MDIEEYRKQQAEIRRRHNKEMYELDKRYALENNKYSVGDVIKDHIGAGVITSVKVCKGLHGLPECIYLVNCYTKAGKPAKREPSRNIYEGNIIK